MHSYTII